jgi:uncharacterized protein YjhX (UPF0386 family)
MACLSKNGTELARFNQLKASYSIRSNGKVLKNDGFGWKVIRLKEGITVESFRARFEAIESKLSQPYRIYRAAVQSEFPLPVRWQYLTLRDLLGDDIDGIYSDLQDRQIYTDLDTLQELHDMHRATVDAKQKAIA